TWPIWRMLWTSFTFRTFGQDKTPFIKAPLLHGQPVSPQYVPRIPQHFFKVQKLFKLIVPAAGRKARALRA
ncbi:hypothetical protein D1157_16130, partial [Anaerotruncus sp. X29]|nr:hypothetical protein [Anaerotruncus sp. X29]